MNRFGLCLNCFEVYSDIDKNELNNRCPKVNCNGNLIYGDEITIGLLMILNKKGYRTECLVPPSLWNPHISITFDTFIDIPMDALPDGFEATYNRHILWTTLPGGEQHITIRDKIVDNKCEIDILNIPGRQKLIFDMINSLLTWASNLPQYTQVNCHK